MPASTSTTAAIAPLNDVTHTPHTRVDRLDDTVELLTRARDGETDATERLFERCLPALRRWARGRLPRYVRDVHDTQDIVQEAMIGTLHHLDSFDCRRPGALQAYLRQAVMNRIRDEIRRVNRRPIASELDDQHADPGPSPFQHAISREAIERYEAALQRLKPAEREAIVARLELQHSYEEVALLLGKPTANAARVAVVRALAKLVVEIGRDR